MNSLSYIHAALESVYRLGLTRLCKRLARKFRYSLLYPLTGEMLFPKQQPHPPGISLPAIKSPASKDMQAALQEAGQLLENKFEFLNQPPKDLGASVDRNRVDWKPHDADPLWTYCLHYGQWAMPLSEAFVHTRDTRYRDGLIRLISDWINSNPVCSRPGWEPYPLSIRLVAWGKAAMLMRDDSNWDAFLSNTLLPSLRQQAQVLKRNLEQDLANNHLIANYRALASIGLVFPGLPESEALVALGLNGLLQEIKRQVLPGGVHFERSISYHAIVLEDCLDTCLLLREQGQAVPPELEAATKGMLKFLLDMQGPDGTYPMFNDSVPDYPPGLSQLPEAGAELLKQELFKPELFKSMAEKDAGSVYQEAGFVILRDKASNALYFDCGEMGPRNLPGHGHAGALSFVLYGQGRPLIVDPGVFSYHDSHRGEAWRDYFRSTQVHNTVAVDGLDQCVFWGAFRVAYPPRVRLIAHREGVFAEAEHTGYTRLRQPVMHKRRISKKGDKQWEVHDQLSGSGEHRYSLCLQLAPGAEVLPDKGGGTHAFKWPCGTVLEISCTSPPLGADVSVEDGWVSEGWNQREAALRYVLKWRAKGLTENRLTLKIRELL